MADLPPPSKPSGIKPPSKIGRPCSSALPKPAVPPQTLKLDGASGSVRKLSDDLIKTRINEEAEEDDDFFTSDMFGRRYSYDRKSSIGGLSSNDSLWGDISMARRLSEAGIRRTSDNSVILTEDTDSFIVGDRVWVSGTKPGRIAYIGETKFAPGDWAGIVLDEPIGKNDGAVGNTRYFQCEPKKGIFSKLTRLTRTPLSLPETSCSTPQTPIPSTPLGSPPSSIKGSSSSRTTPPPSALVSPPSPSPTGELKIGERVIVMSQQGSKAGVLRFKGPTGFAAGEWCGVELDDPLGKNDGTVEGVRYFTCEPKFGLFAPAHKVSRSPAKNRRPSCQIHHNATSLRRASSKESLNSSIASFASSVRTNNTSSVPRKTFTRPLTSPTSSPKPSAQELVKCKQEQINQLLKQQKMDRAALTNAAQQADELERKLGILQTDYDKVTATATEFKVRTDVAALEMAQLKSKNEKLQAKVDELQVQLEDFQFRAEEANIYKTDIQSSNQKNEEKVVELEQALLIEQAKYDSLLETASESESKLSVILCEFEKLQKDKAEVEKALKQELIETMDRASRMEKQCNEAEENVEKIKLELEAFKAQVHDTANEESAKIQNDLQAICGQKNELQTRLGNLEVVRSELLKTVEGKDEELSRLAAELASLQIQIAELQLQQSSSQKEIESQRSAFDELKKNFDEKSSECAGLASKFDLTSSELRESQRLVASQLETIHNLKTEIENNKSASSSQMDELTRALELEVAKVSNELAQSLDRLREKESELEKVEISCKELHEKVNSLQSTCDALGEAARQKDAELAELKGVVASRDRNIDELKQNLALSQDGSSKAVENLNSRILELTNALEQERQEFKTKEAKISGELAQTVDQLKAKELELDNVETSCKEWSEKAHSLESDCDTLNKTVRQKDGELSELKDSVTARDRNIEELKQNLTLAQDGSSKTVDSLNSRIQELTTTLEQERQESKAKEGKISNELAQSTDRLKTKEAELEKIQISLEESYRKINSLQSDCDSLNTTLRQKEAESAELKNSIAVKDQNIDELKQNLALAQDGSSKAVDNLNSRIQELTNSLEQERQESKAKEGKISNELAQTVERLKLKESKLEEFDISCKELNEKVNSLQENCDALNKTVQQKDSKLAELEDSVVARDRSIDELKQNLSLAQDCSSQAVENLNSRIQKLTDTLEQERAESAAKEGKASSELARTADRLRTKEADLEKVEIACKELNKKVDSLQSTCDTLDEAARQKDAMLAELEASIVVKDRNIEELKQNLSLAQDGSSKAVENLNSRVQELTSALEQERQDSKAREEKMSKELAQSVDQLKSKDSQLEKANGSCKELVERVNSLRSDVKNLDRTVREKEAELVELKDSVASKEENIDELKRDLTQARDSSSKAVGDLNARIQELTSALEQERAKLKAQEVTNQESMLVLEQRIANFETALSLSSQTIEALKASQIEKEAQLVETEKHSLSVESELKERIDQLERRLSEANIVLELSQVEDDAEIAKMKEAEASLAAQLKNKDDELVKLGRELAKYEEDLRNANVVAKEASEALTSELDSLKKKSAESDVTINTLNETLHRYESETKVKTDRVAELEATVKSLEGEISKARAQSEAVTCSKADLDQEMSRISEAKSKIDQERTRLAASLEDSLEETSRYKELLETEVRNRASSAAELAKVELRMSMIREEKVNLEEKVRMLQEEISRLKSSQVVDSEDSKKEKAADEVPKDENPEFNNWSEEKEMAESQINFLNSIIVDMKKKNDELTAKLASVDATNGEETSPPPQRKKRSKKVKEVAPRLFCDICDMFDQHDTEDCPLQGGSDSPPPHLMMPPPPRYKPGERKFPERPYCSICEVFGHDSSECDDGETF